MYVDILFIINFAMNYVSLYLSSRLTHDRTTLIRITLSSAFGAAVGVAVCIFGIGGALLLVSEVAAAVLMSLIAYGFSSVGRLAINSTAVFAVASLIGGIMTVGDGAVYVGQSRSAADIFLLAVPAAAIIYLVLGLLTKRGGTKVATVVAELDGKKSCFTALIDSGNLVTEPISAMPAILASSDAVGSLTAFIPPAEIISSGGKERAKIRAVPICSHGGTRIEYGIIPDKVVVSVGNRSREVRAVIVPETRGREDYGGFAATCPISLT